jgi:YfiH family protein
MMISSESNGVKYMQFASFIAHKLPHGFFMRHGGVSPYPFNSLNLGGNNGDDRQNVVENRSRIFAALGRPVESLYDVWQVHSDTIVCTNSPRPLSVDHLPADAILTDNAGITLFMRFADCVPIIVYDPEKKVAGMIHAGWPGTTLKIVYKTIQRMSEVYGSLPANIIAGIGPSICVDHYEIRQDVIDLVISRLSPDGEKFLVNKDGHVYFNLQAANQYQLNQAGVTNVEMADICTACNTQDWFSHRGDKGSTGRYGALLAL